MKKIIQSVDEIPVLVLGFNRVEEMRTLVAALKSVKPKRIYLALDGPRSGYSSDVDLCKKVADLFEELPWHSVVHKNIRTSNYGCQLSVSEAIDWFFSHVSEGIVLEDDCIPSKQFFNFCYWGLNAYRNDKFVMHINGNTFGARNELFCGKKVAFSGIPQVWGWASWSDRWGKYKRNGLQLLESSQGKWKNWRIPYSSAFIKYSHLKKFRNGFDTWDYQWQATVLNSRGYCLCPSVNLVSNIGTGVLATHTKFNDSNRHSLPVDNTIVSYDYVKPVLNSALNRFYCKRMGLSSLSKLFKYGLLAMKSKLKDIIRTILKNSLYPVSSTIVIASNGRAGSTVFFDTVVAGIINDRQLETRFLTQKIYKYLCLSKFVDRVDDDAIKRFLVIKTHDIPRAENLRALKEKCKIIYLHSDPLVSAVSVVRQYNVKGMPWIDKHLYHLNTDRNLYCVDDILQYDVLNYRKQIDAWANYDGNNLMTIAYEDIWEKIDQVSEFLDVDLTLPKQVSRTSLLGLNVNQQLFLSLRKARSKLKSRQHCQID